MRRVRNRFASVALAVAALAVPLAACGGDDEDTTSEQTGQETEDPGPTDPPADSAGTPDEAAPATGGIGDYVDIAGGGTRLKLGLSLPSSGSGSAYAKFMQQGTDLAVKQLAEAGAIEFDVIYKDHQSGDPQAGATVMRELGGDDVPVALTSYIAALGSQLPAIEEFKVLTLDPAGGTGTFAQGSPYFYGTRAVIPNDTLSGMFQWLQATKPDASVVAHLTWDLGPPADETLSQTTAAIEAAGLAAGPAVKSAPGENDYSSIITNIEAGEPDVILISVLDGLDISKFLRQYRTRGGEATVVATANYDAASFDEVADESAKQDFYFTYDFFDPTKVTSDFAQFFVDSYTAEYGEAPNELSASFYEGALIQYELARRVIASGGDPNDSEALLVALEDDPAFVSVYGGDGADTGQIAFDLETHSVSVRTAGIFTPGADGTIEVEATFDVSGNNFQLVGN